MKSRWPMVAGLAAGVVVAALKLYEAFEPFDLRSYDQLAEAG